MKNKNFYYIAMAITVLLIVSLACGGSNEGTIITPTAQEAEQEEAQSAEEVETEDMEQEETQTTENVEATSIPSSETPVIPTNSPTPSAPPLEILSHDSYTDGEWYHIVGEIQNNNDYPMMFVEIVATLYDDDGKVVGTDFTYTFLDVIPPGGKSPFETGTDEWEGTTNYKLQAEGSKGDLPRQDLVIRSHESYIDGDWLHVRGEVENTGTTDAEFVQLVITLYDASDNVVGADFTFTTLNIVPAGGTSPFESGTDHWPNFDHYEIQVEGS